jgi:hypothetical protein
LGELSFFDQLGAPLKNLCSRYVVGNRFLWLCRGQERRRKWKDEVPANGHDKKLFFRKWGEISGLGVYPSLCELVEGIVTVPRVVPASSANSWTLAVIAPVSRWICAMASPQTRNVRRGRGLLMMAFNTSRCWSGSIMTGSLVTVAPPDRR